MNEARERSYYEIALTNGQVLVAFGILLTCVAGAFVSGMWVARESLRDRIEVAEARLESTDSGAIPRGAEGSDDAQAGDSEAFEFFGDEAGGEGQGAPGSLPRPETAMAAAASSPTGETPATRVESSPPPAATPAAGAGTPSEEPRATAEVASAPDPALPRSARAEARSPEATPAGATGSDAASPAPVRVAEPVAEPAAGEVLIQVFSGSDQAQASALVDRLRADGFHAFLSPAEADGRSVYRVRVGPYETREAAEEAAAVIRRRHRLDTWFPRS